MTDRDLLELAAKALGIDHPGGEHCVNGPALWDCKTLQWWKPLTDNGDALRLAVRLRMDVSFLDSLVEVCWFDEAESDNCSVEERINDAQGECEATRRAIVRAAAEIGKTRSD